MIFTDPLSAVQNIEEQIESVLPHMGTEDIEKKIFCFLVEVVCSNKYGEWKKPCAILVKVNIERMEIRFFTSFYEFRDVLEIRGCNHFDLLEYKTSYEVTLAPLIERIISDLSSSVSGESLNKEIFVSAIRTFPLEKIIEGDASVFILWANEFKDLMRHHHDEKTDIVSFEDINAAIKGIFQKVDKLHMFSSGIVLCVPVHICLTSNEGDEESAHLLFLFYRPYNFLRLFQGIGSFLDIEHPEKLLFWKVLTREHNSDPFEIIRKKIEKSVKELQKLLIGNLESTKIQISFRTISVDNVINSYHIEESSLPDTSSAKTNNELYEILSGGDNFSEDHSKPPSSVLIFWKVKGETVLV